MKFDVDGFSVSPSARAESAWSPKNGSSVAFPELDSLKELPRPALIPGEISGARWRAGGGEEGDEGDGKEFAVNIASSRSPGDVYSYNIDTKVDALDQQRQRRIESLEFAEPKLAKWKSFDGLEISGFVYAPDAKKFPGKGQC